MNSKNMPIIMLVSVVCLAVFAGVFWQFGMDKYLSMFRFESKPAPEPGFVRVPPPIPPMDQTTYKVEIAIVEATFAAKKAARRGSGK